MTHIDNAVTVRPLRLWPGVAAVVLQSLLWFVVPAVVPDAALFGMFGGIFFCGVVVLVWWLFLSRATWSDRLGALVLMILAVIATKPLVHASIASGGLLYVLAIPVMSLALVSSSAASRGFTIRTRRMSMIASIALACGAFMLVRTGGVLGGSLWSDLHWRWTPTAEERLLAQASDESRLLPTPPPAEAAKAVAAPPSVPAAVKTPDTRVAAPAVGEETALAADPAVAHTEAEWPGFRGPERNGIIRSAQISTNWTASPPVEMWRRPIGPGWSSFAVHGDVFYTQEQRGEDERVSAYTVKTGQPVWRHSDPVRFWESNGGAGPRATPTLHNGRVYAFGATGILNALDARSGAVIWSHNVTSDTNRDVPTWGFSSSPLVIDDLVIVAASGTLAAYEVDAGKLRWSRPSRGGSYSSPHRTTIDGVTQVVFLSAFGATGIEPATGAVLWEHPWPGGTPIVQPAVSSDGDVLLNHLSASGLRGDGTRRITVEHGPGGWSVRERWTSNGLKPYFNDLVLHEGHAYGFDGAILSCISLEDGARKWKGGRYGNGQLVLLPAQDLLIVMSEEGELALVNATPDKFTEVAKVPALNGKTWNHPVLVRDVLLVRNGEEMAAFRLSPTTW